MSGAVVFAGPTIGTAAVREVLEARCLPPVRQGDVHRAVARYRPRAIGIVDGYFQHVPSVWHKEILWALGAGVHVFGAASMGALRAAELAPFGVRGVGVIFEAYRAGALAPFAEPFEDDDEVALIHGPAETGYVALSEAMVNLRCTLARAESEGVIGSGTMRALAALGKALFYQERTWDRLLALAAAEGLPAEELAPLRRWLPGGRVDQKRADALAMLRAMRDFLAANPEPGRAGFRFQPTTLWQRAVEAGAAACADDQGESEDLLDEIRLEGPEAFRDASRAALLRLLAAEEAQRSGMTLPPEEIRRELNDLRRAAGLGRRADVDRWLADHDLDPADLERLLEDDARLKALLQQRAALLRPYLLDRLRLRPDYARLAARARAKRQAVADPVPVDERRRLGLLAWYFERRRGEPIPDELAAYAASLGLDTSGFLDLVAREYAYSMRGENSQASDPRR